MSAEGAGNQYAVFTGIFVLDLFWMLVILLLWKAVSSAFTVWQPSFIVGYGSFRPDIFGAVCIDFLVCAALAFGGRGWKKGF